MPAIMELSLFRLAQITKGKPFFSRYLMSERKEEDGDKLIAKPGEKEMLILYNSQEGVFSVKALSCNKLHIDGVKFSSQSSRFILSFKRLHYA